LMSLGTAATGMGSSTHRSSSRLVLRETPLLADLLLRRLTLLLDLDLDQDLDD